MDKREPLLWDNGVSDIYDALPQHEKLSTDDPLEPTYRAAWFDGACDIRDHYERLINEGKMRVVEEVYDTCLDVDPYGYEVLFKCSACSSESGERGHNFCPNCGGKIKRE